MSTSNGNRRRLTLMPEVLPTPQRLTTGSVRARTLLRLKVLAALGAAGLAASCGGATDDGGNGGSSGSSGGKGIVNGGSDGGPDAYGVVDPLPTPACFKDGTIGATAAYVTGDAGITDAGPSRQVQVNLTWPDTGALIVFSNVQGVTGGMFESQTTSKNGMTLLFDIDDGAAMLSGTLGVSCGTGMSHVLITLTFNQDTVDVTAFEESF